MFLEPSGWQWKRTQRRQMRTNVTDTSVHHRCPLSRANPRTRNSLSVQEKATIIVIVIGKGKVTVESAAKLTYLLNTWVPSSERQESTSAICRLNLAFKFGFLSRIHLLVRW